MGKKRLTGDSRVEAGDEVGLWKLSLWKFAIAGSPVPTGSHRYSLERIAARACSACNEGAIALVSRNSRRSALPSNRKGFPEGGFDFPRTRPQARHFPNRGTTDYR